MPRSNRDGVEEEHVPVENSPRVLHDGNSERNLCDVSLEKRRRLDGGGDAGLSDGADVGVLSSQELNRTEIEGLICPICLQAWTSSGDHQVSCLPCGHLYGLSCIRNWLQYWTSRKECPQCNRKCTLDTVRKLYTPGIAVVDKESQKRIRFLKANYASFGRTLSKLGAKWQMKEAEWKKKEAEWKKREAELQRKVKQLREKEAEWKKEEAKLQLKVNQLRERKTCAAFVRRL